MFILTKCWCCLSALLLSFPRFTQLQPKCQIQIYTHTCIYFQAFRFEQTSGSSLVTLTTVRAHTLQSFQLGFSRSTDCGNIILWDPKEGDFCDELGACEQRNRQINLRRSSDLKSHITPIFRILIFHPGLQWRDYSTNKLNRPPENSGFSPLFKACDITQQHRRRLLAPAGFLWFSRTRKDSPKSVRGCPCECCCVSYVIYNRPPFVMRKSSTLRTSATQEGCASWDDVFRLRLSSVSWWLRCCVVSEQRSAVELILYRQPKKKA